jgi:hypothetical protein
LLRYLPVYFKNNSEKPKFIHIRFIIKDGQQVVVTVLADTRIIDIHLTIDQHLKEYTLDYSSMYLYRNPMITDMGSRKNIISQYR